MQKQEKGLFNVFLNTSLARQTEGAEEFAEAHIERFVVELKQLCICHKRVHGQARAQQPQELPNLGPAQSILKSRTMKKKEGEKRKKEKDWTRSNLLEDEFGDGCWIQINDIVLKHKHHALQSYMMTNSEVCGRRHTIFVQLMSN